MVYSLGELPYEQQLSYCCFQVLQIPGRMMKFKIEWDWHSAETLYIILQSHYVVKSTVKSQ